ncbi:MAG: response regulator [Candidatus Marinimicrobia bacterium]|nr:response regulator [Candidatus Neomarinimicrobiota bacterium]
MDNTLNILYIDDNPHDIELIRHALKKNGMNFNLEIANSKYEFLSHLEKLNYDLVLTDFNILGYTGLDVIKEVKERDSKIPVIVVTGTGTEEIAIQAMKMGVSDYVIKTHGHISKLPQTIFSAIEKQKLKNDKERLIAELKDSEELYREIFESFPDIYYRTDKNMIMTTINPLIRNFGYEPEEVIGTKASNYYYNSGEQGRFLAELKKTGSTKDYTMELIKKSGELIFVSANSNFLYDENGEMCGIQGVLRDISERVTHEKLQKINEILALSLAKISRNMVRTDSYNELLDSIGNEIKEITGYNSCWFYIFDEKREYARLIAATGKARQSIMTQIPLIPMKGDPYMEEVASLTDIAIIEDAQTDPRTNKEIVNQIGNRTIINVPVKLSDQLLGSLGIGSFGDEGVQLPTKQQEQYFISIASTLAFTVDRIRLQVERQNIIDDLNKKNYELSNFNSLMMNREHKMVELKQEINSLLEKLELPKKYTSPFDTIEPTKNDD